MRIGLVGQRRRQRVLGGMSAPPAITRRKDREDSMKDLKMRSGSAFLCYGENLYIVGLGIVSDCVRVIPCYVVYRP
jgi:hypothetical protein